MVSATLAQSEGLSQIDVRRKQLIYRAGMRGWLELDVLVGNYARKHCMDMDAEQLEEFNQILTMEIPDLFKWMTGQKPLPEEWKNHKTMLHMMEYVNQDKSASFQSKFDDLYFHNK